MIQPSFVGFATHIMSYLDDFMGINLCFAWYTQVLWWPEREFDMHL